MYARMNQLTVFVFDTFVGAWKIHYRWLSLRSTNTKYIYICTFYEYKDITHYSLPVDFLKCFVRKYINIVQCTRIASSVRFLFRFSYDMVGVSFSFVCIVLRKSTSAVQHKEYATHTFTYDQRLPLLYAITPSFILSVINDRHRRKLCIFARDELREKSFTISFI